MRGLAGIRAGQQPGPGEDNREIPRAVREREGRVQERAEQEAALSTVGAVRSSLEQEMLVQRLKLHKVDGNAEKMVEQLQG